MRILFVSSRLPCPPWQGDRLRAYHFLRLLSRRHTVVLVTPIRGKERNELDAIRPFCERIETVEDSPWRGGLRLLGAPFTRLPMQTLYLCPPGVEEKVEGLLRKEEFDLVHAQTMRMGPVERALRGTAGVLDLIDSYSLNMTRRARLERGLLRLICSREALRAAYCEKQLVSRFDATVLSSPADRDALGAGSSLAIVPNGVDANSFPFVSQGREEKTIVFTGRMAYFANADAAEYLALQVFPLVLRQIPAARFLIVGTEPRRRVRRLGRLPGVFVTGQVESIHHYLGKATISVAPMRAGSGVQNKVLEAMASGAPVVATPLALGGIEARDGEHVLTGEMADDLAAQIVRLMTDREMARRLAMSARRLIEERYTWEKAVELLEGVYERAVLHPRAPSDRAR